MKKLVLRQLGEGAPDIEIVLATASHPETVQALDRMQTNLQNQLAAWDREYVTLADHVRFVIVDGAPTVNGEKRKS